MRTIVAACLIGTLGATHAGAADIQGKWGLGAGVSPRGLNVSLIRGKSERSAWLFDVVVGQSGRSQDRVTSSNPQRSSQDQDSWNVAAGPGYRRFLRPDASFSPYWDVEVDAVYNRFHFDGSQGPSTFSDTQTEVGVAGQFALGLEYFFRPHLSVAAHGTVVNVNWRHTSRSSSATPPFGSAPTTTGHIMSSFIGFGPVIFVRGYW